VTLTTIGYGDVYPVTIVGQALTMVLAIAGLGMIALPAGILATGFSQKIRQSAKPPRLEASQNATSEQNIDSEPSTQQQSGLTMDQVLRSGAAQERFAALSSSMSRPEREALLALIAISLSEKQDR
jgi:hypothetical protein